MIHPSLLEAKKTPESEDLGVVLEKVRAQSTYKPTANGSRDTRAGSITRKEQTLKLRFLRRPTR